MANTSTLTHTTPAALKGWDMEGGIDTYKVSIDTPGSAIALLDSAPANNELVAIVGMVHKPQQAHTIKLTWGSNAAANQTLYFATADGFGKPTDKSAFYICERGFNPTIESNTAVELCVNLVVVSQILY